MNKIEVENLLISKKNDKYRSNVVRMGIPANRTIGVSIGEIRKIAKKINKDTNLALELWNSNIHEEMLLAVLIFVENDVDYILANKLMADVLSWDLCDFLCKNLLIKLDFYFFLIEKWSSMHGIYYKRAAFVLMTAIIVSKKEKISQNHIDLFINRIKSEANDSRPHVRKSISWALREIGKINFEYKEKAIIVAYELINQGNDYSWVGKDALHELETLVKVDERNRLLTSHSKMGKKKIL